jgi:hypothetical protein
MNSEEFNSPRNKKFQVEQYILFALTIIYHRLKRHVDVRVMVERES